MKTRRHDTPSRSGSAILTVVIVAAVSSVIIASILRWGGTETRINEDHFMRLEARNAAESLIEIGVSQLKERWDTQTSFTDTELAPGNSPLVIPSAVTNFLTDQYSQVDNASLELIGGVVPESLRRVYLHPDDPINQFDPHKGKRVLVRDVEVYAKATANRTTYDPVEACAQITFQLRDAPLFSHAIFYNMDLEFHPGPTMDIGGPVHANGDIYAVAKSNLYFHGILTTSQRFIVGMKRAPDDWSSLSGESSQAGDYVKIKDINDNWSHPYKGTGPKNHGDSYWDSRSSYTEDADGNVDHNDFAGTDFTSWREFSTNRWAGNLQTGTHGTPSLNPPGFRDYVGDDPSTATLGDDLNYAYAIIEPNLPVTSSHHKRAGEKEKFAYKAGMIIRVYDETASGSAPTDASGNAIDNAIQLKDTDGNSTDIWVSIHKLARANPPGTNPNNIPQSKMPPITTSAQVQKRDKHGNLMYEADGTTPVMETIEEVSEQPVYVDASVANDIFKAHLYSEDSDNDPETSFYDERRNMGLDLVQMDTGEFKNLVEDGNNANGHFLANPTTGSNSYLPEQDYNGIVYVEFPTDTARTVGPDNIIASVDGMGLYMVNNTQVPDPAYNNAASRDRGFTLATNNTIYTKGDFNADGNMGTGSNQDPDDSANPEPPAALAGDAITLLSDNWDFEDSKGNKNNRNAQDTEFNAAIVCGLMPTNKGGAAVSSGGSHNFPRFLEKWSGDTLRYRGSLVALFESEIADNPWSTSYYSPPRRDWGFYSEFGNGNYPPGTPNVRSYRKIDFRYLTTGEYNTKLASLPSDWDSIKP